MNEYIFENLEAIGQMLTRGVTQRFYSKILLKDHSIDNAAGGRHHKIGASKYLMFIPD